ncbi:type IV inositol polyphosphate 5-phosphatase 7-like [Impatiens glandulifera]|uniref:type IV inositol polyphosphate 5-phosphatase 7-like n=1 Tax=Impatiens glandulifera TaxID=253017 RepID=UPI001FB120AB|nr:type IV inositol polyphosphate 5-phosphatase 7-like [Impatiens glandulifera]
MNDVNSKKSKLSWSKKFVRKWFNIKTKSDCQLADDVVHGGGESEWRNNFTEKSESSSSTLKRSRTEKISKKTDRSRRGKVNLDHPQIINVQNYSLFVSTWNVAGRSPSSDLNFDDFIHSAPPADIYVLGFQEVVPLNAGNILVAEDNGPAKKWLSLIRRTLNDLPGSSAAAAGGSNRCYTPSPIPNPVAEYDADFEGSTDKKSSLFPRRSFQAPRSWRNEYDASGSQPRLDRRYSVCDRVIFGRRPSDYRPSDSSSSQRPSDYSSGGGHRPSDYSSGQRPSDYSSGRRASDFSRWGSSDDDGKPFDSPSTVVFSPTSSSGYIPTEDGYKMSVPRQSRYCLVASKQMVGIFITVWVKSDLREHVSNMKVSCVGRGLMGYLGNKGSISVSMLLHQTSFCFVCSHLTSGQKEGDELRRNADVLEILKKTRFPKVHKMGDVKSPETILEHDRIIWLGDLNYRIALSYRSAKALIEMQNWRALLDKDQLRTEQRRGSVFEGWKEGQIYFPPTYKYSYNSDRYSGDNLHSKEKRRTPAWCDRILWFGQGVHQLSYVRGESRFSDHRPVYGIFWAEAESYQGRLTKSASSRLSSSSRIEAEELLSSYSNGYTEFCFF